MYKSSIKELEFIPTDLTPVQVTDSIVGVLLVVFFIAGGALLLYLL